MHSNEGEICIENIAGDRILSQATVLEWILSLPWRALVGQVLRMSEWQLVEYIYNICYLFNELSTYVAVELKTGFNKHVCPNCFDKIQDIQSCLYLHKIMSDFF